MNKILMIVDPQYDFIEGSLAVNGAKEKMDILVKDLEYIKPNLIILTRDLHPSNHSSFKEYGGQWPSHCVVGTPGVNFYQPLMRKVEKTCEYVIINKGMYLSEEYSALDNSVNKVILSDLFAKLETFTNIQINVCGIAGDYCVLETLRGLIDIGYKNEITVDTIHTASIDGGIRLQEFINYCGLNYI